MTSSRVPSGAVVAGEMAADPFDGTQYRRVRKLDAGGMAEVFLVEHRVLGSQFVAKVLHPHLASHPRLVERIRVEAQSLGRLNHPNIVTIAGAGTTNEGRAFIVMEALQGRSLASELAARGCIPVLEAVAYVRQILSALAVAHAVGIVHRDVKPENVFLHEPRGRARVLKMLDFGIARILPDAPPGAPAPVSLPTDTGTVVGTPRYVSPEAARGNPVDQRADLYAVGLVLYTLLAGRGPFDHIGTDAEVLSAHVQRTPPPPSFFAQAPIPAELDELSLKALRKDANERFQSAKEFDGALAEIAELLSHPLGWSKTTAFDPKTLKRPSGPHPDLLEKRSAGVEVTSQRKDLAASVTATSLSLFLRRSALRMAGATTLRHPSAKVVLPLLGLLAILALTALVGAGLMAAVQSVLTSPN